MITKVRATRVMVAIALAVQALGGTASAASPARDTRVIVEFADRPAISGQTGLLAPDRRTRADARAWARARRQALQRVHRSFLGRLAAAKIGARQRAEYTDAYNGVALQVRQDQVAALSRIPGVRAVHADKAVHATVDEDVSLVRAPQMWATKDPQGRADDGTGETVAVVDTGIDYTHPDLGGGFGPGHKVVAGHDFVGDDDDPKDDNGHGTHVAGIVAGDPAKPAGRTGVAPKASLTAYKVLDQSGNGTESTVLAGLEAAVAVDNPHRAQVVNLSLGAPGDDSDPVAQACENAIHSGVVVVAAAGNNGPGESTVNAPALAPDVLAVGASISGIDVPSLSVVSPVEHRLTGVVRLGMSANPPSGGEKLDVVDVGAGQPGDYEGKDAAGKAALISTPLDPATEQDLARTAAEHGARAVLLHPWKVWNVGQATAPHSAGKTPGTLQQFAAGTDEDALGAVAVQLSTADGLYLQDLLAKGGVRISVAGTDATDQMAGFSSHGPVLQNYRLKPDLVAPGTEIHSTWPGGGYMRDTGTSMAAPHVAGAAALVRQAHPDWSPEQVAAALTGSAHPLPGYEAVTEGAGRLDVAAAGQARVLASPRIANLGLADLRNPQLTATKTITLSNVSARPVTLALSTRKQADESRITATVQPSTIELAPGGKAAVTLKLQGARPATRADLAGWLRVTEDGADEPALTVPYLLAVRPIELHVTPDPAVGSTSALMYSEPALAAAPQVTVTDPRGRTSAVTATADRPGWWRAVLPGTAAGLDHVEAMGASLVNGGVLQGTTTFEEMAPARDNTGWQPVGPIGDGGQTSLTPERPGRMYVLPSPDNHAGLFRTDDSGKTWHELRSFPVAGNGVAVAADPVHPDTVYFALGRSDFDPTFVGAVLVSHDAGATWTRLPFPDQTVLGLAVDPTGRTLAATTDQGVAVSTDHGQTWQQLPVFAARMNGARVIGDDLYVATSDGLFVIRDVAGRPGPATLVYRPAGDNQWVTDVVGDGHVIAALGPDGAVVSRDNGATWSTAFSMPDDDPFPTSIDLVGDQVFVAGTSHLWVGREGTGWSSITPPVDSALHFWVTGWPQQPATLNVSASGIGVYRTGDQGRSYTRIGINGTEANALALTKDGAGQDRLVVGTRYDDYSISPPTRPKIATQDWGRNGTEGTVGDQVRQIAASPADPRLLLRTVYSGNNRIEIQRSADGGASWSRVLHYNSLAYPEAVLFDPADPSQVYVSYLDPWPNGLGPGVWISHDSGKSWRQVQFQHDFTALAGDPHNAERIWFGGPDGLFRSDDGGETVTRLQKTPVTALAVDPAHSGRLLVGGDALYASDDGGRTLHRGTYADLRIRVTGLLVAPDGTQYASTGSFSDWTGLPVGGRGVLASTDGGRSWHNVSHGLANLDVRSLLLSPDGHWIFAGTAGGGVYRAGTAMTR